MAGGQHTPGPWGWFGNEHGVYLAAEHSGRLYVMGFERMGMQRAQPTFRGSDGLMHPAADLVEFAVGDGEARGFKQGKADPSVYRLCVRGIDNPDARLISAAPDLLEALEASLPTLEREATAEARANLAPTGLPPRTEARDRLERAREVVAKARPTPSDPEN